MRKLFAACSIAIAALATAPASAETVVVTADRLVDVLAGRTVERPVVVITDGRIVSVVGEGAARPVIPEGATRIDLPGKTLLPGLIDMHVHLDSNPRYGGYTRLRFTDHFWTAQGVANARAMLEAGFTTIRNVGSRDFSDVGIKEAIEEGIIEGPRIVPAGHSLGATGGHCDNNLLPPSYQATRGGVADGPQALRSRAREQRKYGAEVIKACATGGVFSRNTGVGQQQLTLEELSAIVAEARQLGMTTAAHAHGTEGIKAAIEAGFTTIEHASFLDDEAIRMAIRRGTFLSMDIYNTEYTLAEGERNNVLPENLEKERQVGTRQRESFRRSVELGARHVFGSDAGVYPHGTGGRQFARMVQFGMTPMQAIQAATANAAEALARTADLGAIAPGRFGDMIAVDGDPLRDISLLESVPVVIKGGRLVVDRR
ncbi:MAG: amidohydrolase family protein [Allosphingosinicella sp.]|uniref:Xaa-Pro dipeptidase n=1 Tax=Allosphingosinicella sp. TaxID=2823234 RepID=UPI00395A21DF